MPQPKPRIEPGSGLKNWRSNPRAATRISRADGPPDRMFGGVYNREHMSGRIDGRVGGTFADPETENRYRKGLIVVSGIKPVTLADLEAAFLVAKARFRENPEDKKLKAAYRQVARDLSAAREEVRRSDPRRIKAQRGEV